MTARSNPTPPLYDHVMIGAGQAGPFLAIKLAQQGQRVALIEAVALGGTCVNVGCTPSKTLRKSARVAHMARRAQEFGVHVGPVEVDFKAAMLRTQARVDASRSGLEQWLGATPGLDIIKAHGRFEGRDEQGNFVIAAGEQRLLAKRVSLNPGPRPFVPPIPGVASVPYLDNTRIFALRERPAHLLIIGGSYIALEMGQIFRRLGSDVTIIETGPRLVAREDADMSAAVHELLASEGIRIITGHAVKGVSGSEPASVQLALDNGETLNGSHLLLATGRVPNTDSLGLDTIGLSVDARGYVKTDTGLQTQVEGVWALGDINGRGAFTHTSYHDHEIVAANLSGGQRSVETRIPIYAMFTDPPLGHVGLYEAQARALVATGKRRISQAVFQMADVSRAKEEGETAGLIKILVDEDSDRFLGATMLGINADEIIQIISQLMAAGASVQTARDALPAHPTVAEFLPTILDRRLPLTAT